MYIERLYTGCLAEAAYYIESEGEAAVIDPMRETEPYLDMAKERNASIRYVFETHFHADFVSGHIDLARKTGAKIIYGPGAEANYDIISARDGAEFPLGKLTIKVLHTPGHTLESSCYLLLDEKDKPVACFTGDTLFVGEVGRPDLAVKSDLTKDDLAGLLYESLHKKILSLPDDVIVYPGHGAGSSCGKNIGKEAFTTIGEQRKYNYALQDMSKEEFVEAVVGNLPEPPKYFFMDAAINKNGYEPLDAVMEQNAVALDVPSFKKALAEGAVILDTRKAESFSAGFIPGAINIGLEGQFAIWVGSLLEPRKPLVIVADEGSEEEAVLRLARVGYENVKGFLKGGMDAWSAAAEPMETVENISATDFVERLGEKGRILDVRNPSETDAGMVPGAIAAPLANLMEKAQHLDKTKPYYIHCAGGYRSMVGASLLKRAGFKKLTNVTGGYNEIRKHLVEPEMN